MFQISLTDDVFNGKIVYVVVDSRIFWLFCIVSVLDTRHVLEKLKMIQNSIHMMICFREKCVPWIEHDAGDRLDAVQIQDHAAAAIFYESLNLRFYNARIVKIVDHVVAFLISLQLNMYWYLQIFTLLNTQVVL
jgi:hypothetical protein